MVRDCRYETNTSPTYIAYGSDEFTGIFLSVYDRRLMWRQGDSAEISNLTNNHFGGGEGSYLELHTGMAGLGHRVTMATMAEYFKRFGVPRNHIIELLGAQYA